MTYTKANKHRMLNFSHIMLKSAANLADKSQEINQTINKTVYNLQLINLLMALSVLSLYVRMKFGPYPKFYFIYYSFFP